MLAQKIIKNSETKCAMLIVLDVMKDGCLWFCVDYQNANDIAKRESKPIRGMDKCDY